MWLLAALPLQLAHPTTRLWLDPTCGEMSKKCKSSASAIFQLSFTAGFLLIALIMFVVYAYRALRDHAKLPYSHYRLTNIYIRVQVRRWAGMIG